MEQVHRGRRPSLCASLTVFASVLVSAAVVETPAPFSPTHVDWVGGYCVGLFGERVARPARPAMTPASRTANTVHRSFLVRPFGTPAPSALSARAETGLCAGHSGGLAGRAVLVVSVVSARCPRPVGRVKARTAREESVDGYDESHGWGVVEVGRRWVGAFGELQ